MKFPFLILTVCTTLIAMNCLSQKMNEAIKERERPEINKPLPPFALNDVHLGDSAFQLSSNDFRGKWLFLDFWYRGCVTCIRSFPKINALQDRFRDTIRFVLVGVNSKQEFGDGIKEMYENLSRKQGLSLTVAFDSLLAQQWNIHSFPHIIIVDPNGIVRTITAGLDLTEAKLQALMSGNGSVIKQKGIPKPKFPPNQISVFGEEMLHVSAIAPWNGEGYVIPVPLEYNKIGGSQNHNPTEIKQSDRFIASMVSLGGMFRLAFIGKWQWLRTDSLYAKYYPFPILETARTDLFEYNYKDGTGFYNYYLQTPAPATPERIMELMQHELQSTFNLQATIERRLVPVWKLVAKPGAGKALKTKGKKPGFSMNTNGDAGVAGFEFSNFPMEVLLKTISRYISDNEPPFFDYTGIKHNIDIKFDALLTDRSQILTTLRQHGLDLVKGDREMHVLVIRDAKK